MGAGQGIYLWILKYDFKEENKAKAVINPRRINNEIIHLELVIRT